MKSKIRAFTKFLLCPCAVLFCLTAQAELADRQKPMQVEADSMRYDDINKITTATGRVVVTKGTVVLRAAVVEIRQDAQGNSASVATGDAANQAFMRQKREGLNEFFEAQADRIERDDKTLISRLTGKAKIRRLVGNTLADEIEGENIIYNETTEVYQALGGAPSAPHGGANTGGRVRALIVPSSRGTASDNAPKRNTITLPLQASPQIGTKR